MKQPARIDTRTSLEKLGGLLDVGRQQFGGLLGAIPGIGQIEAIERGIRAAGQGNMTGVAEAAADVIPAGRIATQGIKALTKGKSTGLLGDVMNIEAPRQKALDAAQRNAALPKSQGGLGLAPDNTPMQRAEAMGFDVDAWHSTNTDFNQFDPSLYGKASGGNVKASFASSNPAMTDEYLAKELVPKKQYRNAYRNAERYEKAINAKYDDFTKQGDLFLEKPPLGKYGIPFGLNQEGKKVFTQFLDNPKFVQGKLRNDRIRKSLFDDQLNEAPKMHNTQYIEGGQTMPLRINDKNFMDYDAQGMDWTPDMDKKIQALIKESGGGFDGVRVDNIYDGRVGEKGTNYMVFEPSNIRSRFAAFDPARRNEADLLALQGSQQHINLPNFERLLGLLEDSQ